MSEIEKINREFAMIENDLRLARESLLLRIIRNKRQPIASRYAAMIHYRAYDADRLFQLPEDSSKEKLASELKLFLAQFDSGQL